ncbi:DUF4365 domain-containing protein [Nonomuraea antimicrobica]|uniref:DUF4365 domain-containing protein n=1 Tax=Nonomuraea antimicrobica TaxID=561173 RepID=UPI003607D86D
MERIGVHGVAMLVVEALGWKFREQHESDQGIDAIIEIASQGRGTGRLVALQIKSGPSCFRERNSSNAWIFRGPKRHLTLWLEYQLPVLVILFNPGTRQAYWAHVNQKSAQFTPAGYRIDVPTTQLLGNSSRDQIERIVEQWTPLRGDSWSRVQNAIALCRAEGIPVHPSATLWDRFTRAKNEAAPRLASSVLTCNLALAGDAPAVMLSALSRGRPLSLALNELRGAWSVPPDTSVFVCENPLIVEAAIAAHGTQSHPLVCLGGFPSISVEYLLLGLGFCGAQIKVHTDNDFTGSQILRTLFARTIEYEEWCQRRINDRAPLYEEDCLKHILEDLAL